MNIIEEIKDLLVVRKIRIYLLIKRGGIMNLRVPLFLLFVCILLTQKVRSQYYFYDENHYDKAVMFELGASLGGMNCMTDLGGGTGIGKHSIKDLNLKNTQLTGGAYLAATYNNAITLRLEAAFGQVKAYDSILKKVASSTSGRYERNLSFRSPISEFSLIAEIHPLFIFGKYDDDHEPPRLSPYALIGIGYFSFNPQAKLGNVWVDLQPLHLEGQGFKEYPDRPNYSLQQINIPVGAGFRYELSPIINVRAEVVYRVLSTDYLDDVSQTDYVDPSLFANYLSGSKLTNALLLYDRRYELNPANNGPAERGHSGHKDSYFSFNLKVGITFGRERIRNR